MENGQIETIFCASLSDVWDNEIPAVWRSDLFDLIEATPNMVWLILSKRIGNAIKMCDPATGGRALPKNVAVGATMVNQEEWDRDASKLMVARERLNAIFSFASIEPMLGPIDIRANTPDWVIVGGESGANARPMRPVWAQGVLDQAREKGVSFFFKQWGNWVPPSALMADHPVFQKFRDARPSAINSKVYHFPDAVMWNVGKRLAGDKLGGQRHQDFPWAKLTSWPS